jgi:hypothetical protein
MTKNLTFILAILFCSQTILAQKASDVLEKGEPVTKGHRMFLKYDITDKVLKVDAVKKDQEVDFTTLQDSIIYLVRKNSINVYLRPLNPLNYSYNTETKVVIDPINEAAANAMGGIIDVITSVAPKKTPPAATGDKKKKEEPTAQPVACTKFEKLKTEVEKIQTKLTNTKKEEILKIFETLKAITFLAEQSTKDALTTAKDEIKVIEDHFNEVEGLIIDAKTLTKDFDGCDAIDGFTGKYIFNAILKDLSTTVEEQKKRLTNLQTAYKLVKDMQEKASVGGGTDELKWCIPLNEVASNEGKISIYTVTIKESGYKSSETTKEIVSIESKELIKRTVRVRKFQRFVPEVSVGTAFTFFKYNSYGTTSDSTGQQFVGSPNENMVRNINITTMLNFNYYIPNSPIHPLYQLGVGINSGIPTILSGFGLRSNINGIKRLAISGGIAMSWIKELDKLKVGDKISGTDDIEKDYKYGSAPKFTPYVGLQFNF